MSDSTDWLLNGQKLKKAYATLFKRLMKEYDLTKNEIDVLLFLKNNEPYDTAKDIVELRALSKSQVCKSIEHLMQLGYLKGEQDRKDRRCIHLKLETQAVPIVMQAKELQKKFLNIIYEGVTEEEKKVVEQVFLKILKNAKGVIRDDS